MLNADQRFLALGCYINSALYLAGCFVAGLALEHPLAWKLALVCAGVCYFSYFAQVAQTPFKVQIALTCLSIFVGVCAGLALL